MDFPLDNFITYPRSPNPEFPLDLAPDDLFPPGYLSTPDMDKLGSFPSESGHTDHTSPFSDSQTPKDLETVKPKKTTKDLKQVSISTKQIKKKQLDQERAEKKDRELAQLLAKASKKYIPPQLYDPNIDPKTKRHLIQVVKNRMAAQQTRDRRKQELEEFDEVKVKLEEENKRLLDQNSYLMERLKRLEENQIRIMGENQQLKHQQANQAMQSSFIAQQQMMQNQALNNSYMSQQSMQMTRPMSMPMQQMSMSMSGNRSFTIDPADEEKNMVNLVPAGGLPVLTRGTNKKTPFGYLFSLTTILLIFQTLTVNPTTVSKTVTNPVPDVTTSDTSGDKGPLHDPGTGLPYTGEPEHRPPEDGPPIEVDVMSNQTNNTNSTFTSGHKKKKNKHRILISTDLEDFEDFESYTDTDTDLDRGSGDNDTGTIARSSKSNRFLGINIPSSEALFDSTLQRLKRFLGSLYNKIKNEAERRL